MTKSGGKILLAGLIGAAAGAVGGILFAPKAGKETREDIKKMSNDIMKKVGTTVDETQERVMEIFGNVTKAATDKYNEISGMIMGKVAAVKTAGMSIDKEKYSMIVDDVVEEFKDDFVTTKNGAVKVASMMKKDWEKVKKALV